MKLTITYLGSTSSNRGHKYAISLPTFDATNTKEKFAAAIAADGIVLNANVGEFGFISQTHLYLTKNINDKIEIDVLGYKDDTDRQRNYFANIDKNKQRRFAESKRIADDVFAVVAIEEALADAESSIDVLKFEQIRLLKLQQSKLQKEIAALSH